MSDVLGNFELKVEDDTPLVFSFVGYDSKEVKPDFYWQMLIVMKIKTIKIEAVGNADSKSEKVPSPSLVFIDGKESTIAEMTQIDLVNIEKVDILKDKKAIEKYGKKGKDGVILVTLKKEETASNTQTFKVQSNSPLKFGDANSFGKEPLIFIDGVVDKDQNVNNIPPETIESISVLKDASATKAYGEKGKNGVILIKTRKVANAAKNTPVDVMVNGYASEQGENTNEKPNSRVKFRNIGTSETGNNPILVLDGVIAEDLIFGEMDSSLIKSVNVIKGEIATKKYGEKGKNGVIEITMKKGSGLLGIEGRPLVVIDGVITKDQNVDKIDPNTIESVSVLKDEMATQKYGEKGKNGVIQITLKKTDKTYVAVEEMPEFPGGTEAINPFIKANLQYPKNAVETGITGKVFIDFTITKTGKVENVKISKGLQPLLDEEALRVIRLMPDWKPGTQNGEKVEVKYQLSVSFNNPNFKQKEN
jgi:TonB family protein